MDGSIDALSAVQMNKNVEGLDASAKYILKQKEFLSVILHLAVPEYEDYTQEEIMGFIEGSTISVGETELSNHQTNTVVSGENTEFKILNEKVSYFDILFKAVNPILSDQSEIAVNLHINIEPQLNYKPGYPIEKRGIYYLAREMSSQLGVVTEHTDYGQLEKCYSIWICRDNVPEKERDSVSVYEFVNTRNTGDVYPKKDTYDLMSMIIIRLGKIGAEKNPLVRFLNSFFFPGQDTLKVVSEYIDFSNNEALKEEVGKMRSIGASIYNDGLKKGWSDGEDKLGKLISYLFKIGKPDEAEQAANDKKKRQELYEKYNIK